MAEYKGANDVVSIDDILDIPIEKISFDFKVPVDSDIFD